MAMALKGERILLVDDDETISIPFQLILQDAEYHVDTALTGRQALEKAEKAEYQMAILDVELPDIKGIEVARKMRKQHEDIHFIIVTGYPEIEESIETINLGIGEILLKPIEPDELLRAVKECFVGHAKVRYGKDAIPP